MRGCRYIFYDECVRVHLHTHLQYITFRKKRQEERENIYTPTPISVRRRRKLANPTKLFQPPLNALPNIHVIIFINWITANHRIAIRSDIPHIVVSGARKCGNPPWKNYEVIFPFGFVLLDHEGEKTKQNVRWAARAEAILLSLSLWHCNL